MRFQLPLFPRRVRFDGVAGSVVGEVFIPEPGYGDGPYAEVRFDGVPGSVPGHHEGAVVLTDLDDCEDA